MIIKNIEVKEQFVTKYEENALRFDFNYPTQYITGPNGYGKTTMFELIYQMILKDDIDDHLKELVGSIKLGTDQGDITFDHVNGLQKHLTSIPQIRYKRQLNEGFSPAMEDIPLIIGCKELMSFVDDYCDKRDELLVDVDTGKLIFRNKKIGYTFPLESAPIAIQNIIMMFLFAVQTKEGDILLIEHPEEHLHLYYQRKIMDKLEKECGGQIIITTHSPSIFSHIGFDETKDLYVLTDEKNENNNS